MIHHVSPRRELHVAHIGDCDTFPASSPIDHAWPTLPEVEPGRCEWCLASDNKWRDLLARADTVKP